MKKLSLGFLFLFLMQFPQIAYTQSLEIMPGTERFFADVQFLKFFDQQYKVSIFSRTRLTTSYSGEQTNLFSGAYLNYTAFKGFGPSIVGRVSSFSAGVDVGIHYVKSNEKLTVFALPTIQLQETLSYSWFSIVRFTPSIQENWKLYSSLELFSNFNQAGHAFSVQRIRLGLMRKGYAYGLGVNVTETGRKVVLQDSNWGVFLRKSFN